MWESRRMSTYWTSLLGADPAEALAALGRFATGLDCVLAARGTALRGKGSAIPIIDRKGCPMLAGAVIPDPGLDALGVELIAVDRAGPAADNDQTARIARLADIGALVCRAALMMRCLAQAYAHLEGRESAGQQTLQLSLVKATFAEGAGLADRIRREAAKHLEGGLSLNLVTDHAALSATTTRVAKLMGGHGYLAGRINAIETLSLLIAASFIPRPDLRVVA